MSINKFGHNKSGHNEEEKRDRKHHEEVSNQHPKDEKIRGQAVLTLTSTINLNLLEPTLPNYYAHIFHNANKIYQIPLRGSLRIIDCRTNAKNYIIILAFKPYSDVETLKNVELNFNDQIALLTQKTDEYVYIELIIEYQYEKKTNEDW